MRCNLKKALFKASRNLQENNCAGVYFLIKLQAKNSATLLKKDPSAGDF